MLQLRADLCLFDESVHHAGLSAVAFAQDLHRQITTELDFAGVQHDTHATARDLSEHLVAAAGGEDLLIGSCGRRHGPALFALSLLQKDLWEFTDDLLKRVQNAFQPLQNRHARGTS